jgi:hypothetical protein
MTTFILRELGDVKWFLALRVIRDRNQGELWLVQDSYIEKLVERFNINGPPAKTPLSPQELHAFEGTATPEQILGYQQRIGSCLYAAIQTRPDISFTVAKLSQFLTNPGPDHHSAAYRLLSYLSGTRTLGIEYGDTDEKTPYEVIFTSHPMSAAPEGLGAGDFAFNVSFTLESVKEVAAQDPSLRPSHAESSHTLPRARIMHQQ